MQADSEIKARAVAALAVLGLTGGAAITIVPEGFPPCGGRQCWTHSQADDDPVFWWSPDLDLEHQPPGGGSGVVGGGTAVNGPPLRLNWNTGGAV